MLYLFVLTQFLTENRVTLFLELLFLELLWAASATSCPHVTAPSRFSEMTKM
jgi:hypothetical protein